MMRLRGSVLFFWVRRHAGLIGLMGKQLATAYRPVLGFTALVLVGLLLSQFISPTSATSQADNRQFAQKVNLALRRTAHHLLIEQGDSTSRIQPVQQPATNTFSIRLERPFAYGRVPHLLQESFAVHAVRANYDVSILDCATRELQLGYNYRDLIEQHEVPCGGRQQGRGCYTLQVTFALPEAVPQQNSTVLAVCSRALRTERGTGRPENRRLSIFPCRP